MHVEGWEYFVFSTRNLKAMNQKEEETKTIVFLNNENIYENVEGITEALVGNILRQHNNKSPSCLQFSVLL